MPSNMWPFTVQYATFYNAIQHLLGNRGKQAKETYMNKKCRKP